MDAHCVADTCAWYKGIQLASLTTKQNVRQTGLGRQRPWKAGIS